MKNFFKTLWISLQFLLATTMFAVGYGFFAQGRFTFAYVFDANFFVGTVIILTGLIWMILPAEPKNSKLIDHTTYGKAYMELRGKKQEKALGFLFLGMFNIIVTGIIQLLLSLLIV